MIEFQTTIAGKTVDVGVSYQHHRGYKDDPLRRMSKTEAQWAVIADLSKEYAQKLQAYNEALANWRTTSEATRGPQPVKPNPPSSKSVKLALTGPDTGSGTTCQILDLSGAKPIEGSKKRDFTSCTVLGQGHSNLSKLDNFSSRAGREESLTKAVKAMNLTKAESKAFWDNFFAARRDELAKGWMEAALKSGGITEDEKDEFLHVQTLALAGSFEV